MDQSKETLIENEFLKASLSKNLEVIIKTLGNSTDLIIRDLQLQTKTKIAIIYMDGLANQEIIQDDIIKGFSNRLSNDFPLQNDVFQFIKDTSIMVSEIKEIKRFQDLYKSLVSGDTLILLDGYTIGLVASTKGWEERSVDEPYVQTVVRGPREGFTENIRTNTALIRRKIKDPNLWLETKEIGRVTKTAISIMYIKGIVEDDIVKEVHTRLDKIDIDSVLESGYIEEFIQDAPLSPFPTIFNSERPDVVAAEILEGRIAILVDGTPFVLIVPSFFSQHLHAAEDYYNRSDFGLLRLLRYICLITGLLAPSVYIAITTFHVETIPTVLLISLAAQREGVPFPAFVEALIMEAAFEILREAGVRMPKSIGQAISIVGALVIGQAAVEAGFISNAMVIIVSITAISTFVLPSISIAIPIRILRFVIMMLAAIFGLVGVTVGFIAVVLHLCSLKSFGVPYMTPFAPFIPSDQKDNVIRVPRWRMKTRPKLLTENKTRKNSSLN